MHFKIKDKGIDLSNTQYVKALEIGKALSLLQWMDISLGETDFKRFPSPDLPY
jgi:hypothetical protein